MLRGIVSKTMLYNARRYVLALAAPLVAALAPIWAPRNLTWVTLSLGATGMNMFNAARSLQSDMGDAHAGGAIMMPVLAAAAALVFYGAYMVRGPGRFVAIQWLLSFTWFSVGVALIVLSTAHDKEYNAFVACIYIATALNVAPIGADMDDMEIASRSLLQSVKLQERVQVGRAKDENGYLSYLYLPCMQSSQPMALVLLHDWQWGAVAWLPVMEALSARFDVFAVDLRGCGSSARDRRASAMTEDLNEWRQEVLGERPFTLVGWGLGGVVAAQYFLNSQDRHVRRLVMLSADGVDDDALAESDQMRMYAWWCGANVFGSPDLWLRAAGPLGNWFASELLHAHVQERRTDDLRVHGGLWMHEHTSRARQSQSHRYLRSLHRDRLQMWADYWYCNLVLDGAGGLRLGTAVLGEAHDLIHHMNTEAARRCVPVVSLSGSPLDDPEDVARNLLETIV